jgi:hypothetical protein
MAVVHTTGVNWESVGTILGGFATFASLVLYVITRIIRAMKEDVKEAVNHLAEVLGERLETKDTVSKLTARVAVIEDRERRRR